MEEYLKLCEKVFEVDQVVQGVIPEGDDQCRFDYKKLEEALKIIIRKRLQNEHASLAEEDMTAEAVRTFLVATNSLHADGPPAIFRSYSCRGRSASECAIWEAGRATSAVPTFFKPITIKTPQPGITYADGGLTYNNPTELALQEAQRIWPSAQKFCVVSVGTGRLRAVRIAELQGSNGNDITGIPDWIPLLGSVHRLSSGVISLRRMAEACVTLATNSEPAHQRVFKQANSSAPATRFPYHRFNVGRDMQDIGFQEWQKIEEIASHTLSFMEESEGEIMRDNCVTDLMKLQPFRTSGAQGGFQ